MKLLLVGYSGHVLDFDLAKEFAYLGNTVRHLHCSDYIVGKADFLVPPDLLGKLDSRSVSVGSFQNRYSPFKRILHEIRLAKKFHDEIRIFSPEFIVTSNVPLFCSFILTWKLVKDQIPYIFWWQDVYSAAINNQLHELGRRLPIKFIQSSINNLEKYIASHAHRTIAISENFFPVYKHWGLKAENFSVFPNWSPLEDFVGNLPSQPMVEPYVLYAGTLGLKHNPRLLLHLAQRFEVLGMNEKVVVISQGLGRDFLEAQHPKPHNLILKDFLSVEQLKDFLASAKVALAILEPRASEYSVPSKIMTYLAAGKATVAAIPKENPASKYIESSGSGIVVDPLDEETFTFTVIELLKNPTLRSQMELKARQFAEENFSGKRAAKYFLDLMN
jgi:glycosyltransferase involved in cell wall biosynthesis